MTTKLRALDPETARGLVSSRHGQMVSAAESHAVFTGDECERIVSLGETYGWDGARVESRNELGKRSVDTQVRRTERCHLIHDTNTAWIYDRLASMVERANARTWQFRLSHMEPLQLLRYPIGGHYSWHSDLGTTGLMSFRKVSASILLSDPSRFDGGSLEIQSGGRIIRPEMRRGSAAIFPAWQLHRVEPVSHGLRYSLVLWVIGKRSFR